MNIYNNKDIDNAIESAYAKFPFVKYDKEIHLKVYTEILIAICDKSIKDLYAYSYTVALAIIKSQIEKSVFEKHD